MKIDCAGLEARLEVLVSGGLAAEARRACEEHLSECARCADLVELAALPAPAVPEGTALVAEVLRRTSGAICESAEKMLAARSGNQAPATELLEVHLTHCDGCRALDRALAALALDLPELAELPPGPGFVNRVMAASLPPSARLRRWRHRTWPAWVRRPRFALEMAYALTALFVVLFSVPGTPLAAMPGQAVDLARTPPHQTLEKLEKPVREGLAVWEASEARQSLSIRWSATERRVRTFLDGAASWLENATEDTSSRQAESTEESS